MVQPKLSGAPIPVRREPSRSGHDVDEFADFFLKEYRSLVGSVMRAGATLQDAEEAVAEAMAVAESRFAALAKPAAYVRAVALRLYARRAKRDRQGRQLEEQAEGPAILARPGDDELRRLVGQVLRELPTAQQIVMALTIDGYKPSEIAELIGSSRTTVRSNLRHARRSMADALRKGGWNV